MQIYLGSAIVRQMNCLYDKRWALIEETLREARDNRGSMVTETQYSYIPSATAHRMYNLGKLPMKIISTQSSGCNGKFVVLDFADMCGRTG